MSKLLDLARPELKRIRPYTPGAYAPGLLRLNANESPWRSPGDKTERGLNIYPPPRPEVLRTRLSSLYGVPVEQLLVTRGSSEAIDVLIRGFCRAGQDRIVVMPPTFDMYRLYAGIQNAAVVEIPLRKESDFAFEADAVLQKIDAAVKLVFVCSPNNPTGNSMPRPEVERLCEELTNRALVVIDEAYFEFASAENFSVFRQRFENAVLLRTLSKFVSLAGVRCGALLADPGIVEYLGNVLPPYTFPTPSIELVSQALTESALDVSRERVSLIKRERRRVAEALGDSPLVERVFPSDANFLLVESNDLQALTDRAFRSGILIRTFSGQRGLERCTRITIGRPEDNDRLIRAISSGDTRHGA
jgi:histidinol-phosphate aminotransferase